MHVLVSWRQVARRLETSLVQVIQGFAARFSFWRRRKGSNHPLPPPPPPTRAQRARKLRRSTTRQEKVLKFWQNTSQIIP